MTIIKKNRDLTPEEDFLITLDDGAKGIAEAPETITPTVMCLCESINALGEPSTVLRVLDINGNIYATSGVAVIRKANDVLDWMGRNPGHEVKALAIVKAKSRNGRDYYKLDAKLV